MFRCGTSCRRYHHKVLNEAGFWALLLRASFARYACPVQLILVKLILVATNYGQEYYARLFKRNVGKPPF
jgi:hypothetical protein